MPVPPVACQLPGYPGLPDVRVADYGELLLVPAPDIAQLVAWVRAVEEYRKAVERCPHVIPGTPVPAAPPAPLPDVQLPDPGTGSAPSGDPV